MISFSWEIVTTLFTHRQSTHTSCSCKWETTVLITKETGTRRRRHLMLGNFYVLLMVGGWQLTSPWSKILERVGLAPNPCYGQIHVFYVLTSTCLPLLGWVTYSRQSLILKLMNYILETIFKKFVILCVSVLIFKMYQTYSKIKIRIHPLELWISVTFSISPSAYLRASQNWISAIGYISLWVPRERGRGRYRRCKW